LLAAPTLEAELDRIAALGLDEVRALWQQNAPKALSRHLLARMIAYGFRSSSSASSAARCAKSRRS
jgi:hypothetical protein